MANYIMGRNCLLEILRYKPERIVKIYVLDNKHNEQKQGSSFYEIMQLVEEQNFAVEYAGKKKLCDLVFSDSHQGFVAELKPREYLDLKEFFQKAKEKEIQNEASRQPKNIAVMLDTIMDPHNFGAILRAAECFAISAIIFSKNRGSSITPAVCKVSCGASELVDIVQVSNLAQTVERFKEEGFEAIVADNAEKAQSLFQYRFADKTLLIMGSEEKGVQPLIKKSADSLIKIPLLGKVDSLNVSQAAAVFLACSAGGFKNR